MGESFTLADCAAAPPLNYAQEVFPFGDRKAVSEYWRRLCDRPSWQAVLTEIRPVLESVTAANA